MLKPLKAITKLPATHFVDTQDYKKTVLLTGTGRSGTTWLGDMINYANAYRSMFEPFHARKIDLVKHFNNRQYLRPDNTAAEFLEPAPRILSGAVRDP